MHRFPEALRVIEKLNDDAASDRFIPTRAALGVTHLHNPVLSSANEQNVLLYTGAAAAHTRARKQNAAFIGRAFYSYAASLLEELRSLRSIA